MILIYAYRVPLMTHVLEFPSGLCDSGDPNECCLRELKARSDLAKLGLGRDRIRGEDS